MNSRKLILRTMAICASICSVIIVSGARVNAQDDSVRKQLDAFFADRDKAIKTKDIKLLHATRSLDFTFGTLDSSDGFVDKGAEAHARADRLLVDTDKNMPSLSHSVTDVHSFSTKLRTVKRGRTANEMIVETAEKGKMQATWGNELSEMTFQGKSRHLCVLTDKGWRIKRTEEVEFDLQSIQ